MIQFVNQDYSRFTNAMFYLVDMSKIGWNLIFDETFFFGIGVQPQGVILTESFFYRRPDVGRNNFHSIRTKCKRRKTEAPANFIDGNRCLCKNPWKTGMVFQ